MRKGCEMYDLISPGDRVAVGVSGGKDSVALLAALVKIRQYMDIPFELVAITIDMGFGGMDWAPIAALCAALDVPYHIKETEIGPIIFDIRKETNPCALCARMRRGSLHDAVKALGCNKLALGHHLDDAVETFFMNLFNEGRIGCFSPKTYLSRKDITMIRPLVLAHEKDVRRAVEEAGYPVVKNRCPADGVTNRQATKEWLRLREQEDPGFKDRIFGALCRSGIDGWGVEK